MTDLGYYRFEQDGFKFLMPIKEEFPLFDAEKNYNKMIGKIRVVIEHINSQLKRFRILSERLSNRRKRFGLRINLIAALVKPDELAITTFARGLLIKVVLIKRNYELFNSLFLYI